jgi:hypothetical protein
MDLQNVRSRLPDSLDTKKEDLMKQKVIKEWDLTCNSCLT